MIAADVSLAREVLQRLKRYTDAHIDAFAAASDQFRASGNEYAAKASELQAATAIQLKYLIDQELRALSSGGE